MRVSLSRTQMCYEHCFSKEATYMATQYGFECWCSHETDLDYARHSDDMEGRDNSLCTMACEGDEVRMNNIHSWQKRESLGKNTMGKTLPMLRHDRASSVGVNDPSRLVQRLTIGGRSRRSFRNSDSLEGVISA